MLPSNRRIAVTTEPPGKEGGGGRHLLSNYYTPDLGLSVSYHSLLTRLHMEAGMTRQAFTDEDTGPQKGSGKSPRPYSLPGCVL